MLDEAIRLPDNIAALKAMVLTPRAAPKDRNAGPRDRNLELHSRDLSIEKLRHQLAGLHRQRFGQSPENIEQLEIQLEDEDIEQAAAGEPVPATEVKRRPKHSPLSAIYRATKRLLNRRIGELGVAVISIMWTTTLRRNWSASPRAS